MKPRIEPRLILGRDPADLAIRFSVGTAAGGAYWLALKLTEAALL